MPDLDPASPAFVKESRSRIKCEMTPFLDCFCYFFNRTQVDNTYVTSNSLLALESRFKKCPPQTALGTIFGGALY